MELRRIVFAFGIIALLAASSCATPSGGSSAASQSQGADPASVKTNFVDAVVEACGNYFLSGLDIKASSSGTSLGLSKLRAGSRYPGGIVTGMPVYVASDGIVHVKENLLGGTCEVYAYGVPVSATFSSIAERLVMKGYVEDELEPLPEKQYRRSFSKSEGDIRLNITTTGNEPGAEGTMSRFSTLTAYVSFKEAE